MPRMRQPEKRACCMKNHCSRLGCGTKIRPWFSRVDRGCTIESNMALWMNQSLCNLLCVVVVVAWFGIYGFPMMIDYLSHTSIALSWSLSVWGCDSNQAEQCRQEGIQNKGASVCASERDRYISIPYISTIVVYGNFIAVWIERTTSCKKPPR